MPAVEPTPDYTATFKSFRHGSGYVAKAVIHFRGKPVRVFEAQGATINAAEEAARAEPEEICKHLRRSKRGKTKVAKTRKRVSPVAQIWRNPRGGCPKAS